MKKITLKKVCQAIDNILADQSLEVDVAKAYMGILCDLNDLKEAIKKELK